MSRELIAAQSGWGKSWVAQYRIETNLDGYDYVIVADYCDEYRGLVKSGLARYLAVGSAESSLSAGSLADVLRSNPRTVAARAVGVESWREFVATIAKAARALDGDVLVAVDEAHFVARLRKTTPKDVEELATTGRGQGISSIWITQRLAKLDPTVSSQCDRRMLGGFTSSNDVDRVDELVGYPGDVHNPQATLSASQKGILRDAHGLGTTPLEETGPGSEWIYSTRSGDYRRVDSSQLEMRSTHYGPEGSNLSIPG